MENFKVGDLVQFHIDSEQAPVQYGRVTRVDVKGNCIISPFKNVPPGHKFVNIKKVEN